MWNTLRLKAFASGNINSAAISSGETHYLCDKRHSLPAGQAVLLDNSRQVAGLEKRGLRMLFAFWKVFVVALIVSLISLPVVAEQPTRPVIPTMIPPGSTLLQHPRPLTQSSGYIFAGTVKSVAKVTPKGNGVATVEINFHIDQGLRGVQTGQMLAIHEWSGLWESGESYRSGERVLLFLYPPSKLGLTSLVQGAMGRFKIGPDGRVAFDPGRIGFPAPRKGQEGSLRGKTRVTPVELVRFLRSEEE